VKAGDKKTTAIKQPPDGFECSEMNFAILRRPRTQALVDGTIGCGAPPVRWLSLSDPLGWALPSHERHRDLSVANLDGGEMSISSFVQAKSRGARLTALPVFLKRGLVQRSLYCNVDSSLASPDQLVGKKVGLVSYTSSMAVWARGVLNDAYALAASSVQWLTVTGSSDCAQTLQIPDEFSAEKIQAWEELDGYPHELDRRESFLLTLLEREILDAVVSFQARIDCAQIRPVLPEDRLRSHPLNSQIYPINHLLVVKTDVLDEFPTLGKSLLSAFRNARQLWANYQQPADRQVFELEMKKLGYDPFAYYFGNVEKATLDTFVGYLTKENLIDREIRLDQLCKDDP
jgi:4,5-dihydroxyphthalate decarboxylase